MIKFKPFKKLKSNINFNHRSFFTYDDSNKVESFNHKICIDKAELKAYLKESDIDDLLNSFAHERVTLAENIYLYKINLSKEFGVFIELKPYNKLNAKIYLHSKFTTSRNNSPIILDILNRYKWFIRRLDIAIDYNVPYKFSALLKRHGNQLQSNYETGISVGNSGNPHAKALESHYDRLQKYKDLETDFINRFEVKLQFEMKERVIFANLNHSAIAIQLKKELFIPHVHYSNLSVDERKLIKIASRKGNHDYLKQALTTKQYQQLRERFKASRDEIEDYYLNNSHVIYDFLLSTAV